MTRKQTSRSIEKKADHVARRLGERRDAGHDYLFKYVCETDQILISTTDQIVRNPALRDVRYVRDERTIKIGTSVQVKGGEERGNVFNVSYHAAYTDNSKIGNSLSVLVRSVSRT